MRTRDLCLPACALGAAALLLAPGPSRVALGYSLHGESLGLNQRDFRVFNNFADGAANDNHTLDPNFPGATGAVMAIWKACVEWGSGPHGDGQGDPHQPGGLGSGGANFDPSYQGLVGSPGGSNENIHSAIGGCSPGVLAYTVIPASDGWQIRYCDGGWTFDDGPSPSLSGGNKDIQGTATHEYGHALGLGHSGNGSATMYSGAPGNVVSWRSISGDDIAGIQAIYGLKSSTKPTITGVSLDGSTLTISGHDFSADNNEVWFSNIAFQGGGQPIKVAGVGSSAGGTAVTVTVPSSAGPGDVLVRDLGKSGGSSLSNAWPLPAAPSGPPPPPPVPTVTGVTPDTIEAVSPGPQPITITGTEFTPGLTVTIDGVALKGPGTSLSPEFTVVDVNTIQVADVPLLNSLGQVVVEVANLSGSASASVVVVPNATPVLDLQSSDPEFLYSLVGAVVVMGSQPGDTFFLGASDELLPTVLPGIVSLGIGDSLSSLLVVGSFPVDPTLGHTTVTIPFPSMPFGTKVYIQAGVLSAAVGSLPLLPTNIEAGTIAF